MRNKRGFTLVELLAVVVILGIIMMISLPAVTRWIDRSKTESKESMKKTLVMATQSYAQANKEVLPKAIGQTVTIDAKSLKDNQYLKEELQDANKKSCMSSYVKVYKSDKNKYTYTPYLTCEGDAAPAATTSVTPNISIGFSGNASGANIQNVQTSSFKATISGGKKGGKDLGVDGYSYSISVKYTNDTNEKSIEIYNSGSLNGGGKPSLVIEKSLGDYTDITRVNEFIVTVKAYNSDGGYKEQTASSLYKDTTPPTCGTITGQAAAGSWLNTMGSTRTISVLCSDNKDGSGCVRDKYSKTFDTEMEYGTISIYDNAGNKTDCKVRVNIDWTFPTLTITAYHRAANGAMTGEAVGRATISHSTRNQTTTLNVYEGSVGGWLNRATYGLGVVYEIAIWDNLVPSYGQWRYNSTGIYRADAPNITTYTLGKTKKFTPTDNKDYVSLTGEGMRRGRYDFWDEAGNTVKIYINANIDLTSPTCSTRKSHLYTPDGVNVAVTCNDSGSKCSSDNNLSHSEVKIPTVYTVRDNAGNRGNCSVSVSKQRQKRTKSCSYGNTCTSSGCGTTTCYGSWGKTTTTCSYSDTSSYGNTSKKVCKYQGYAGDTTSCTYYCDHYSRSSWTCNLTCSYISVCGCASWNGYGSWYNVGSCSEGESSDHHTYTDCQTIYY